MLMIIISNVNSPDWRNASRNVNIYIPIYSTLNDMENPTKLSRKLIGNFTVEVGSKVLG